jgi:NADH:ubiquinone oxidoreductase subunit E
MPELDEKMALSILESYDRDSQQLIAALLDIQEASGRNFVDKGYLRLVSKVLRVPLSRIYEIVTFYGMFSLSPRGMRLIEICESAPCLFSGGERLLGWLESILGVKEGETTEDGFFTLLKTGCFGACDKAPAMKIGGLCHGVSSESAARGLIEREREALLKVREMEELLAEMDKAREKASPKAYPESCEKAAGASPGGLRNPGEGTPKSGEGKAYDV